MWKIFRYLLTSRLWTNERGFFYKGLILTGSRLVVSIFKILDDPQNFNRSKKGSILIGIQDKLKFISSIPTTLLDSD